MLFASQDTPKVTDFGLAKRLEERSQTETGQVLGSPSYIPPEQAQGRSKDVGPTADVYALGAILYETLTGRPPFKGTTPVDTVMQVLHDEPLPPSRLSPQVPRDLETICLKCLAKEPHRRYPTALALAEDLDRYLSNQPIRARRTPLWEQGLKSARRRPTFSALGAVGFLLATIVLLAVWRSHAERRAHLNQINDYAERSLTEAHDELLDGGSPVEKLSRLVTTLESKPELSDQRLRAANMLEQARRRRDEHDAVETSRDRFREFLTRRNDALFHDAELTGLALFDNVALVRKAAAAALEVFAADGRAGERWQLATLPASLTAPERDEVVLGCYEMLLVLSEAVSQPLPGESAASQAREALKILARAPGVRPYPSRAFHLRRADYLEKSGDTELAIQARAEAESMEPNGAFDHFWIGLAQYKRGLLKPAKQHFDDALHAQPGHFWAQCLLAFCALNPRTAHPAEAKIHLTACLHSHPELPWLYLLRGFASGSSALTRPARPRRRPTFTMPKSILARRSTAIHRESSGTRCSPIEASSASGTDGSLKRSPI